MADDAHITPGPGSLAPPGAGPSPAGCLLAVAVAQFVVTVPFTGFLWLLHQPWWGGPQDPASVDWLVTMVVGALVVSFGPWLLLAVVFRPRPLLIVGGVAATSPLWLALIAALAER